MCETIESTKEVIRPANGRMLLILNPSHREIGVVQVDGCLINDSSRRVDWMVRIPEKKKLKHGIATVKLVELKGANVLHAFTQMQATMLHPAMATTVPFVDEGYIVSQQRPSMAPSIQIAKFDFFERFGIPIRVVPKAQINANY